MHLAAVVFVVVLCQDELLARLAICCEGFQAQDLASLRLTQHSDCFGLDLFGV